MVSTHGRITTNTGNITTGLPDRSQWRLVITPLFPPKPPSGGSLTAGHLIAVSCMQHGKPRTNQLGLSIPNHTRGHQLARTCWSRLTMKWVSGQRLRRGPSVTWTSFNVSLRVRRRSLKTDGRMDGQPAIERGTDQHHASQQPAGLLTALCGEHSAPVSPSGPLVPPAEEAHLSNSTRSADLLEARGPARPPVGVGTCHDRRLYGYEVDHVTPDRASQSRSVQTRQKGG